jgi:hypothetical protein
MRSRKYRLIHRQVRHLAVFGLALALTGCHGGATPSSSPTKPASAAPVAAAAPAGPPPLPPLPEGGVRGLHVTGWVAGLKGRFGKLIDMIDRTQLNAVAIDVKDDGQVSYPVDVPLVKDVKNADLKMFNVDKVLALLNAHHIFPIARIACFRDTPLAEAHPELAVHDAQGRVWHDRTRHAWLNPYKRENWDYNVDIALDAVKHGFKEVQFDYVRFASEGNLSTLVYDGKPKGSLREDQIAAFMKYARDKVHAAGAWFSADVFGLTSKVKNDEGIGQKFQKVVQDVDYLCPMCYPSHYAYGEYHMPDPNKEPYKTITLSVGDAKKRLVGLKCKLRPWIQDFSLRHVHYGPAEVKAQIKALNDLGIHEYLVWNAACKYQESAYGSKAEGAGAALPTASQQISSTR